MVNGAVTLDKINEQTTRNRLKLLKPAFRIETRGVEARGVLPSDLGRGVPLGSCRGYPVYDKLQLFTSII